MKAKFILCLALGLSSGLFGCSTTPHMDTKNFDYGNVSIAEVGTVRLEVAQLSNSRNGIQIRVRDYAAHSWQKKNISCNLYYMDDNGKVAKEKFMSVTLDQVSPTSDDYSGEASDRDEFDHGNKFEVVYKSEGLSLPISTWHACYYH